MAVLTYCEMPLNENMNFFGMTYTLHLFCVIFKLICAIHFKERMFIDKLVIVGWRSL